MSKISYSRHRFPSGIIRYAVWLYFRFPLSYRIVDDLLAKRGIDVSYETIRRWAMEFGLTYALRLGKHVLVQMSDGILMRYSLPLRNS
jgi:putative transposase